MKFKNGLTIRRMVESSGEEGWVFWIDDCFDPPMFLCRGENMEDAYAWFICDPFVERSCEVTDYYEDYIEGWDPQFVYGVGNTNKATLGDLNDAHENGRIRGSLEWNDNGKLLDTESIQGVSWEYFHSNMGLNVLGV